MNQQVLTALWWKARLGHNEQQVEQEVLEKFTKLIVEECGALLMSPEFIGRSDLDWSMVLNEHFGVK